MSFCLHPFRRIDELERENAKKDDRIKALLECVYSVKDGTAKKCKGPMCQHCIYSIPVTSHIGLFQSTYYICKNLELCEDFVPKGENE